MKTKKLRRDSGRVYPISTIKEMKYSEIPKVCLEPQEYWDDWVDYRDGQRAGPFKDRTKFKPLSRRTWMWAELIEKNRRINGKLKRMLKIREARKTKRRE